MPTPKVARNLGTLTFHRYRENRRISTIRFQTLKYTQGNYVRHFWGTTPARRLSGTTTPHATTSTSSVRQHTSMAGTAPLTRQCTPYEAPHPIRGTTPPTRHHTPYEALHPLRGTAPLTLHHTRYGALHPIRRGVMPTDRVQRPQSQEQTRNLRDAGQAAVPVGGGGAWPGNAQTTSPTDWRPPRGLRGLAGLRADAPSEARGADGERAGRPRGGRRSVGATSSPAPRSTTRPWGASTTRQRVGRLAAPHPSTPIVQQAITLSPAPRRG